MKTKIQKFKIVFFGLLVGGIILFGIFSFIQNISLKKSLSDLTTLETGQEQSDIQKMGFYGNIKSVYEFSYNAIEIFGFVFRGRQSGLLLHEYSSDLLYFDKNGKIIKSINYSDNWISTTIYHYYSNGIKKEEKSEQKEYFGDQGNEGTSQFNFKGNLISNVMHFSNGVKDIFKYDYDKYERLIEERMSYSGSNVFPDYGRLTKYHYNSDGNIVKVVVYNNEDSSLISKKDYKYNEKGYLVEIDEFFYVDSSPFLRTTYNYDYKNRLSSKIVKDLYYEPPMNDSLFVYTYDSEGNLMQEDQFGFYDTKPIKVNTFHYNIKGKVIYDGYYFGGSGGFISDNNNEYDNEGRLIKTVKREIINSKESFKKIIYKYKQKKGFQKDTWFKKIYYTDDKPENIVIRKLEFY